MNLRICIDVGQGEHSLPCVFVYVGIYNGETESHNFGVDMQS